MPFSLPETRSRSCRTTAVRLPQLGRSTSLVLAILIASLLVAGCDGGDSSARSRASSTNEKTSKPAKNDAPKQGSDQSRSGSDAMDSRADGSDKGETPVTESNARPIGADITIPYPENMGALDASMMETIGRLAQKVEKSNDPGPILGTIAVTYASGGMPDLGIQVYELAAEADPENAAWHHLRGLIYLSESELELAVEAFSKAAEIAPTDRVIRERLVFSLIEAGRLEEAFQLADQLLKENREDAVGQIYLARLLLLTDKDNQALLVIDDAFKYGGSTSYLYQTYLTLLKGRGDTAAAEKLFQAGVPQNLFQLADPYERRAEDAFLRALPPLRRVQLYLAESRLEEAELALHDLILENPQDAELLLVLVDLQGRRGRFDEAAITLDRVEELAPDSAEIKVRRGMLAVQAGNFAVAGRAATEAITLDPTNARAHWIRGVYLHGEKRMGEARAAYERSLRLAPDDVRALLSYSQLLVELEEWSTAIPSLEKLSSRTPDSIEVFEMLTNAYVATGQPNKAVVSRERMMVLRMGARGLANSHMPLDMDSDVSLEARGRSDPATPRRR